MVTLARLVPAAAFFNPVLLLVWNSSIPAPAGTVGTVMALLAVLLNAALAAARNDPCPTGGGVDDRSGRKNESAASAL